MKYKSKRFLINNTYAHEANKYIELALEEFSKRIEMIIENLKKQITVDEFIIENSKKQITIEEEQNGNSN